MDTRRQTRMWLQCTVATMAALLLRTYDAAAASGTWYGTLNNVWATTNNWNSTNAVPGTGNTATFNNAGNGNTTLDLGPIVTNAALVFDTAAAAAYTIGSGAVGSQVLMLNDSGVIRLTASVTNSQTVNANLTLGTATAGSYTNENLSAAAELTIAGTVQGGTGGGAAAKTYAVGGPGNATVSGAIANGGASSVSVSKYGAGTLILSATNTFTGNTTAGGGVLRADYGVGVPSASGVLYLNGGGVLETTGTIARTLGTAAGNVNFSGSGGFAARGGPLSVTFNSGSQIVANSTGWNLLGTPLVLGSRSGDSVLTFGNSLNFQGNPGTSWQFFNVIHNPSVALTADKVVMPGALWAQNGNVGANQGYQKLGNGRLELTGVGGGTAAASVQILVSGGVLALTEGGGLSAFSGVWTAGGDFEVTGTNGHTSRSINQLGISNGGDRGGTTATYGGSGIFTIVPQSGYGARLSASSVARAATGTVLFRGTGLGTAAYPSADVANLMVTDPTGLNLSGAGGAAGSTTLRIVPWAIGDNSATGNGTDFVTHTNTTGIRLLTAGEYATTITDGATVSNNVNLTSAQTINSATLINALRLDNAGGVTGSGTLTLNSGAILALSGNGGLSVGTLAYGTREAVFATVGDLTVGSAVTGTTGLTKSGSGTLTVSNASGMGGTNTVVAGRLAAGAANALPRLLKIQPDAVADMAGYDQALQGLTGPVEGIFTNSGAAATLTFNPASGSYGPGPVIAGDLNVVKTNAGTNVFAEGRMRYSGTTTVNGGVFEYQFPYTSTAPSPIPGGVSLEGGTLRYQATGGNGGATLADALAIGAGGGTLDFRAQTGGGGQFTPLLTNVVTLGGNLTLVSLGNTHACNSGVTLQKLALSTSPTINNDVVNTDSLNGATVYLPATITAPTRTLTLGGTAALPAGQLYKFQITGATSNSLDLANLTLGPGSSLYVTTSSGHNVLSKIRANGGVLTAGGGSSITLQATSTSPGPIFDPAAVVWQGTNTLTFERDTVGNRDSYMQISSNLTVSAASGLIQLTAIPWRATLTITSPYVLTVGSGGTLVWTMGSQLAGRENVSGNISLFDGAAVSASYLTAGTQGGIIRTAAGTLTLGDGTGTPGSPSVVTVRGNQGVLTNVFKIGYATNVVESGAVRMRYASTNATAGNTFNVGWSGAGDFSAALTAFRTTSGGTEFAPLAGGGGVAVVGATSGAVAVFSNAVTVSTGGTVGFYNAGTNNIRGGLGTVVVTNGGVVSITNALGRVLATNLVVNGGTVGGYGTFAPVDMTFTNGGVFAVALTGAQTNNSGKLAVSNALTFAAGSQLTVDTNAYAPTPNQYWYIASASSISGLPSTPADYSLAVEGTTLRLTKLASGTAPDVENRAPSDIAHTSATMNGYLNSTGTADTTVSVYWGTADGGATAAAWAHTNTFPAPAQPGAFSTNIATLVQDRPYYYRYYASNSGGEDWPTQSEHFITGTILVSGTQNAGESGPVTGRFTFSRSPLLTNETLVVNYVVSGTASNGLDYAPLSGAVSLPAGASNVTIDVVPVNDAVIEGTETVTVTVVEGRYVPGSPASASIELQDYVARNLVWTDASGSHKWNSSDVNWTDGAPRAFTDGDMVTFDDSAVNRTVALVATVQPSVVTFLNTSAATYRLTNGVLAGASAVTVGGGGTVKLGVDGVETTTPQAPAMTYSGGTVISNNSLVKYSCGSATPTNALGGGSVTLNGGRLNLNFSGSLNGGSMWLSNPLAVGTLGGTLDLTPDGGGNNRRPYWYFPGGAALGGLLTVYWDGTSQGLVNSPTFSGVVSLTSDTTISNGIVNPAAAVTLTALSGAARTLTLAGAGGFALSTTAAKLNLQNLICNAGLTLSDSGATGADPLTTLRANGGLLTMGPGTTLSFLGLGSALGQTINPAEIAWQGNGTLNLPIVTGGNGDSYWRIASNLVVSTASGLTRVNSRPFRGYMTVDAPYALTVGTGGTFSVSIESGQFNEYLNGNLTLLDGSIVLGANIAPSGPYTGIGGMIRGTSGTLTLGDGSGTPASPSVVTVQGNHGSGYNTFNLGYHRTNTTESGAVRMKYASTSATAGNTFNVGWSGGGAYNAALTAFRETAGGTEFAPMAGGAGVAVVGASSGTVATFTNAATISTAGTAGFYNADPNNTRGALGPLAIGAGGTLAFTSNGTVRASDVTLGAGSTWQVALAGVQTNACSLVQASVSLTFGAGVSMRVTGYAGKGGPWVLATAPSITGLPNRPAGYLIEQQGSSIVLKVLAPSTVVLLR